MERFVNPDNSVFYTAIRSEIYVDKTGKLLLGDENNVEVLNNVLSDSERA